MEQWHIIILVFVAFGGMIFSVFAYLAYRHYSRKKSKLAMRGVQGTAERIATEHGGTFILDYKTGVYGNLIKKHPKGKTKTEKVYSIEYTPPTIFPFKQSHYVPNVHKSQIKEFRIDEPGWFNKQVMLLRFPKEDRELKEENMGLKERVNKAMKTITLLTDENRILKEQPAAMEKLRATARLSHELHPDQKPKKEKIDLALGGKKEGKDNE